MKPTNLVLCAGVLAGAGCAATQDRRTPVADTRTDIPYDADSRSGAYGSSGTGATVGGKDDTAPPRGDASGGLPPPRTEPDALQPPRRDELPQQQR